MTTEYLFYEQVELVLAALMPGNALVCKAIDHTGLRISDVLELKPWQIRPRIWVTEKKTGKRKQIGFPEDLREAILAQASEHWAFPSPKDPEKHRTRQTVWHDLKRAAKAFRLPQNVGTHSFRKTYAVKLMHKYGDIERVRKSLNHSFTTTTMIYALADHLLETKPKRHPYRQNVKSHLTDGESCGNVSSWELNGRSKKSSNIGLTTSARRTSGGGKEFLCKPISSTEDEWNRHRLNCEMSSFTEAGFTEAMEDDGDDLWLF